ncbi:MAG: aldo/keto reductase [Acidimicrobiales bacterium]|nr:aldo/keto reductase [Acidimicrobiales bacterium]
MEQRAFPHTEVRASVVGLGCNNFGMFIDQDATTAVVDAALGAGVTFFDTAAMYGGGNSEVFLGQALEGRRDQAVIATKFPQSPEPGGCSPANIRAQCEASLDRLGMETIDLYQQHYPDPETPVADVLGTLGELVAEGKVKAIGHSNFTPEMHDEAQSIGVEIGTRFASSQIEWNMLQRGVEEEVIPACARNGVGVLPYFPLASGLLTGKHTRDSIEPGSRMDKGGDYFAGILTPENFDKIEALTAWAADHDSSLLQLALQWLASQATVISVIAGATKPEQVASNAAAVSKLLSAADLEEIDGLLGATD